MPTRLPVTANPPVPRPPLHLVRPVEPADPQRLDASGVQLDYDALAQALLRQVVRCLADDVAGVAVLDRMEI